METRKRIDFRQLCEAPFDMDSEYDVNFRMLVYTGEKREEKPVFRTVIAKGECKVSLGNPAKEFWGIIGFDQKTGENQWYNYNDCVSLDGWGVLDRLLRSRFGWMATVDPAIAEEVKEAADALCVTYTHVRKVYAGTAVSDGVVRRITRLAKMNRKQNITYPDPIPVCEQMVIEWDENN